MIICILLILFSTFKMYWYNTACIYIKFFTGRRSRFLSTCFCSSPLEMEGMVGIEGWLEWLGFPLKSQTASHSFDCKWKKECIRTVLPSHLSKNIAGGLSYHRFDAQVYWHLHDSVSTANYRAELSNHANHSTAGTRLRVQTFDVHPMRKSYGRW